MFKLLLKLLILTIKYFRLLIDKILIYKLQI
jgi:hypothetical protein